MNDLVTTDNNQLDTISSVDQNPVSVYLAGLASGSRRAMLQALDTIARIITTDENAAATAVPWWNFRYQHVTAVRAALSERYAHTTANKMLSALRGVLKASWRLGLMTADDYHTAVSVENVTGETITAGRAISQGEIVALLNTCEQTKTGIRDAAMISLLYGCGLRRGELVGLSLGDYDRSSGRLIVCGKRNKQRIVPVVNGAARSLADWLSVRNEEPGPLFVGVGNRNNGRKLTTQAVYDMLKRRAASAGIAGLSPHDFRRTFVGDLLDAGADIVTVQKMVGHANVETTSRYDRRDDKAKERAAALLHVPYTARRLVAISADKTGTVSNG